MLTRLGAGERPEALYAYDAMALVLDAVRRAGADRAAVVRAALAPRSVRGVTGPYRVGRGGDVARPRLAVVDLSARRATVQPVD
jgi:ABC-type branched-subunit amino acid transport system substrate-binding protein